MKNDYEVRGDVTAIIINSPKYGRKEALISTSKLERANEFPNNFFVLWDDGTNSFYVVGAMTIVKGKHKGIQLHRWITNAPKGMVVDHINHDTLDNTDENLRLITHAENQQNRNGANKANKIGIRGVSWNERDKKFHVMIKINGKVKHIGCFSDLAAAETASKEARKKYMPFSGENIA